LRKALVWIGAMLFAIGVTVIIASGVMRYLGYEPSYNLGDPTRFEFVLVPFWQIGLAIGVIGGVCLLGSRLVGLAERQR
jgi:TRAP-type C4-dicarboxylate transport system permease small subunit